MFLHRICNAISRNTRLIILTPNHLTVGNCAEDIYFGLLKARREGKKLLVLFSHQLPWKFRYRLPNHELLNIESEYRWGSEKNLATRLGKLLLTLSYFFLRVFRYALAKSIGIRLHNSYFYPSIGCLTLWRPREEIDWFSWEIVDSYNWKEQFNDPLPIHLKESRRLEAEKVRNEMGLPRDSWFVCLHVREGGYYNDYKTERSAAIFNYIPAILEITSRGGWVVRMGDPTMTPLPPMERVIDYPHTRFKSEVMDLYLIDACRFFIGVSSGVTDIAVLFQKPQVLTNMPLWIYGFPLLKGDLTILKHVYSKSKGRFLSLQEILAGGIDCQLLYGLGADYSLHENSPEEIRDVVLEFLERLNNGRLSPLQEEFNRRRILEGRRILGMNKPISPDDRQSDVQVRYRIASRIDTVEGAIGRRFVEQNWDWNSRTL